jgi:hypothetical protein
MARADDRPRLEAAFEGLDKQTIYTRTFSFRKCLSEAAFGWRRSLRSHAAAAACIG